MDIDSSGDDTGIRSALEAIGLSAVLIFGATLIGQGLGFLTRVTMARYLPVNGYGSVVIGISVLNLFGLIALAGMPAALSRYLPRQETATERRVVLSSAFQVAGFLSLLTATVVYLTAEPIATGVFDNSDLVWVIRIFAGVLPFYTISELCLGGFRGYERTYPRVLLQSVLRPGLQLAGIVAFVALGFRTRGIAVAYAVAFVGVAVVGTILLYRVSESTITDLIHSASTERYRELLAFSIPLAASGAVGAIAKHSDIIILGIFKSSTQVGIYEVTFRVAIFVYVLFVPAFGYLFEPIMSRFDANNRHQRMDELYTVATRWVVVASLPIFALFFLFPGQTLGFFFGEDYRAGQTALRILLIGFLCALLPGLTSGFLTAVGETKRLLYIFTAAMFLNIGINVALIPTYGVIGAAIATAIARTFGDAAQSYYIHREYGVHPFAVEYTLPTALMLASIFALYIAPLPLAELTFGEAIPVTAGLGVLFLGILLLTRSIYAIELELIDALLARIGIPVSVSRHLQPFVR